MSSIVIKISFGEILRRLNVSIVDKKLAIDIVMLKAKICSLFTFGSDVVFTMTYVDEDGDTVTLVDDDDLHDVVRQSLNPLRITASLNNCNFNGSSGVSTPLRPSQNQLSLQTLKSGVSEFLKSVPEPLLEAPEKRPLNLASKAQPSLPVVAELYSYVNQTPIVLPATGAPSNVNPESVSTVVNPEAGGSNPKKEKQVQKVTEGVKFNDLPPPKGGDRYSLYLESESFQAPSGSTKGVGEVPIHEEKNTIGVVKKNDSHNIEQINQMGQQIQDQTMTKFGPLAADINSKTNESGSSLGWTQGTLNAINQCPFSGMSLTSDTDSHWHHGCSRGPHVKRFSLDNNDTNTVFHNNVCCDGCGVYPISGPRFKSKVKDDYDLCDVCFVGVGNVTDYIRIDHPINGFRHYDHALRIPLSMPPHSTQAPGSKLTRSKLDSQFILDVNVLDGTIMAPLTAFTKIWRMRNNGSIIWPYGSQLQWIGGDRLGNSDSVDIQIPLDGLPVDKELDIAVDFSAPELPGCYISYWMMSSPSGQKFGQRVWVLIQVDASMKNLGETSINLNLPPVTRDLEAFNRDYMLNTSVDWPLKNPEMSFPVNDSVIFDTSTRSAPSGTASSSVFNSTEVGTALGSVPVGHTGFYPTTEVDTELISYLTTGLSVMPPVMSSGAASVVMPVISDEEEQALVKELEQMGFKQPDLSKEILRINNYDMEKSIDDLCGVFEWDHMLYELHEMGFTDDETNMRLLKKNNGSIMRVVMDLINGEKA